jgi:hypothetical protein
VFDQRVKQINGWLPEEWNWYLARQRNLAYCCGIVGGNRVDFLTHYADRAIEMAINPRNQVAFDQMENKPGDCLLIEQYFLAACLEYHQHTENSPFRDVTVECLFDSPTAAFSSDQATQMGYTHLIGAAKRDATIAKRLEKRVAQDYPAHYACCLRYLDKQEFYLTASLDSPVPQPALSPAPAIATPTIPVAAAPPLIAAPDRWNRVINASWHHDQVMSRQELAALLHQVGLVIQFAQPVRVDSLHPQRVWLWSHTDVAMGDAVIANSLPTYLPAIQPVRVTEWATQAIRWRRGDRDINAEFELITAALPLETAPFTEAIRLQVPTLSPDITSLTVGLRGDWIISEVPLFALDLTFAQYLAHPNLAPELHQQFGQQGILLSNRVTIAPELPEPCWRCCDQETGAVYWIRRAADYLTVCQPRALDGNHLYPGVPERPSGNGCEGGDWLSVLHLIEPSALN